MGTLNIQSLFVSSATLSCCIFILHLSVPLDLYLPCLPYIYPYLLLQVLALCTLQSSFFICLSRLLVRINFLHFFHLGHIVNMTLTMGSSFVIISSHLLQHEKAVPCSNHTEKLIFVRHSSEYETLDSDRKVNRNLLPDMRVHVI